MLLTGDALCFPHARFLPYRGDLATPVGFEAANLEVGLLELADTQVAALGRLLPSLLCGEESAFQVFYREGYGTSNPEFSESQALAYRIASEELEHERLLRAVLRCCPVPGDLTGILRQTRRFFRRMESHDIAVHFGRIAALDSGVCIILSTIIKPVSRASVLVQVFNRIRRDEARHIRFSRQHSCRLGANRSSLENTAIRVRTELVTLLNPLANSFEELGVDADCLFRRVARERSHDDCEYL
jgi:rubrerythrin